MGLVSGWLGLCQNEMSASKGSVLLGCINRSTVARKREAEVLFGSEFTWLCPKTEISLKGFGRTRAYSLIRRMRGNSRCSLFVQSRERWSVCYEQTLDLETNRTAVSETDTYSRGSSQSRKRTHVSCISCFGRGFLICVPSGKPQLVIRGERVKTMT